MSNGIVFQVETDRVLKILTRDIYVSPLALLRENVQNAYDAALGWKESAGRVFAAGLSVVMTSAMATLPP